MTITINVPVFPMRKEIAARKRKLGLSIGALPLKDAFGGKRKNPRYSRDGLEFDVSGIAKTPESSPAR